MERSVHLQHEEDRAPHGHRAEDQHRDDGRIARREEAEARKDRRQPENKYCEEDGRTSAVCYPERPSPLFHVKLEAPEDDCYSEW